MESKVVVIASLLGDLAVAATKFAAGAFTGSSALIAEGFHTMVDSGNGGLLLYGLYRSRKAPDERHPLGYGRELYFWSFVVSLLLFLLGAGFSIAEGISRVSNPRPIDSPIVVYAVLAASAVFEGAAWTMAWRPFRRSKGRRSYWEAIKASKNPPIFMVLVEDTAALLGILIAAVGTFVATRFEAPVFDGVASILIGLVLALLALLLAKETKDLLIGERASDHLNDRLVSLAEQQNGVERVNGAVTTHLSPDQIVASLSLEFDDDMRTPEIEKAVEDLERSIRSSIPEVVALYVKPQSAHTFQHARKRHGRRGV
jgi:cation diffusion facilitator family transporter